MFILRFFQLRSDYVDLRAIKSIKVLLRWSVRVSGLDVAPDGARLSSG